MSQGQGWPRAALTRSSSGQEQRWPGAALAMSSAGRGRSDKKKTGRFTPAGNGHQENKMNEITQGPGEEVEFLLVLLILFDEISDIRLV